MTGGRRLRRTLGRMAAAVAATAALAACGSAGPAVVGSAPMVGMPSPAGVSVVPPGALPLTPLAGGAAGCEESPRPSAAHIAPGHMPPGSPMARILARGSLVAGVDQDSDLLAFRNPSPTATPTGDVGGDAVVGFEIDMLHRVAEAIFGDPNRITFKVVTPQERIPYLASGQVDVVADALAIPCAGDPQIDYSDSYLDTGQQILVPPGSTVRSLTDLRGRRVCAAAGTAALAFIDQRAYGITAVQAVEWSDCLVLLQQGGVDAVSGDGAVLAGLLAQDPALQVVGPSFTSVAYGLAVVPDIGSGGDPHQFVRFLNGVLAQTQSSGAWSRSFQQWFGGRPGIAVSSPPAPPPQPSRTATGGTR